MNEINYTCRAKVWIYDGPASWHFISIPKAKAEKIKELFTVIGAGFGSLRVSVTLGHTTWITSIFPDNKAGTYLLPLKKEVRQKEGVKEGDSIHISFSIMT